MPCRYGETVLMYSRYSACAIMIVSCKIVYWRKMFVTALEWYVIASRVTTGDECLVNASCSVEGD
uniref:Uncharacterized protein n=1 Tax=Anguilla anguilla TaxID=7936 RepID=A0A0E9QKZ7_ANGAN